MNQKRDSLMSSRSSATATPSSIRCPGLHGCNFFLTQLEDTSRESSDAHLQSSIPLLRARFLLKRRIDQVLNATVIVP